ncbi:MAG: hypothetical protein WD648_15330 [Planctomycetaceae bacterium]
MNRSLRSVAVGMVVLAVCGLLLMLAQSPPEPTNAAEVLQAGGPLRWYRGNIHTHSLWSDGDDYLEMIALWYRDRNYDFLCFTDHNVLSNTERWSDVLKNQGRKVAYDKLKARFPDWIDERTTDGRLEVRLRRFDEVREKVGIPDKFLLLLGEEISDRFENLPVHLNVSNIREAIPPLGGDSVYDTIQNNVNAAIAQRERTGQPMMVHLNHPNFYYAVTAEDLMKVRGEKFFEVYNGHPSVHNIGNDQHASTEQIWDIVLTNRLAQLGLPIMYGLATDDGHEYHKIPSRHSEPGRGWVMVLADELKPASLISAMEHGRFYASSGVTLDHVATSPAGIELAARPEPGVTYTIEFVGTRRGYNAESQPVRDKAGKEVRATRRYSDDIGVVLKKVAGPKAEYRFSGDELYVRARITSSRPHPNPAEPGEFERAWAQPVIGPAAPKTE